MDKTNHNESRNVKRIYNYNIKYPFIKIKDSSTKDTKFFSRKMKKSDTIINNNIEQLLLTGFEGTEEDFKNIYFPKEQIKRHKFKKKSNITRSLTFFISPDFNSNSLKLHKMKKVFKNSDIQNKATNMKNLLNMYNQKNKKLKENEYKYEEKYQEIYKDKNGINITSKNANSTALDTYKNYTNKTNNKQSKYSSCEKSDKAKRIRKIRNLLNKKSKSLFDFENKSIQQSYQENNKISKIELEKNQNKQLYQATSTKNIKSRTKSREKDETQNIYDINQVFKKYLLKNIEDNKLRKVLDPLQSGFKSNLKEVQKFIGNSRENIWMKRSTANLISFGASFQLMPDDVFYRNHKRILGKYPDLEKDAQLLVLLRKPRDASIIRKLEKNQRKIRFICNDNDFIMRIINKKCRENKKMRASSDTFKNSENNKNKY